MRTLCAAESGHKNNFDVVRFILASAVVYTHSFPVCGVDENEHDPLLLLSEGQWVAGTLALNFFFVISGFLVTQSWDRSTGIFSFLKKRILRIYPGFIAVCFASAFVFGPLGLGTFESFRDIIKYWSDVNIRQLIYTSLQLQVPVLPETFKTLPDPNNINPSLWTIPHEFICYLFVPLVYMFRRRYFPVVVLILVLAANVYHVADYQYLNDEGFIKASYLSGFRRFISQDFLYHIIYFEHYLLFFVVGMCFYAYRNHIPRSVYLAIMSVSMMLIATYWDRFRAIELVQAVFGAYLLFYFVYSKRIHLHNFARYGDLSYGVFLYGWPVQQLVFLYAGQKLTVFEHFFVSMLVLIPIAYLSWHLVESPFLSLKNKNVQVRRELAGAVPQQQKDMPSSL